MTQYMMSVQATEDVYEQMDPSDPEVQQIFEAVGAYNKELEDAGAWVFGGGLEAASTATVVREQDGEVVTTDGPYAETKEFIGGFWVIEADDLDEALNWARKATVACQGPVEVRPFQAEPEE